MRTRSTTDGSLVVNAHDLTTRRISNNTQVGNEKSWSGEQKTKVITDVEVPGFAALVKCGKFLPLNPVDILTRTEKRTPYSGESYRSPRSGLYQSGAVWRLPATFSGSIPVPTGTPDIDTALLDAAVIAARANAAGDKWDFLTFLAEMRGTVDAMQQIGSAFNARTMQFAVEASAFKKNPWKRFREIWLGSRYSIRPLVYDFFSASLALKRLMNDQALIKGMGHQVEEVVDAAVQDWAPVTGGPQQLSHVQTLKLTRTYRSRAYIEVDSRLDSALQIDPLLTAWELTPYSFVVDWFVDIGSWVSTLTPTLRGDFAGTCWSVRDSLVYESRSAYRVNNTWDPAATGTPGFYRTEVTWEQYRRGPYNGLPFPSVLPDITLPRLVDLVALFVKGRNQTTRILNRR